MALVVISPARQTSPVVSSVSQATRAWLSCSKMASRMPSEIWSAILSGWPIETDSLVNRYRFSCTTAVGLLRRGGGWCGDGDGTAVPAGGRRPPGFEPGGEGGGWIKGGRGL